MTTALLTGPSRGIGRATALELSRRGCTLGLIGRASPALDGCLTEVREISPDSRTFECDLASPGEVARAARRALDAFGAPDVVVHNAAVVKRATVEELPIDDWDEQLAVNLRAPFLLTRAVLPHMKEAHRGRLVFVGSISSVVGTARSTAYNASKWGLLGFVKSLAEELSGTGITAVAVLPGSVDTRMLEGSGFSPDMSADDVAKTLAHYALDAPAAHNGATVEMFGT